MNFTHWSAVSIVDFKQVIFDFEGVRLNLDQNLYIQWQGHIKIYASNGCIFVLYKVYIIQCRLFSLCTYMWPFFNPDWYPGPLQLLLPFSIVARFSILNVCGGPDYTFMFYVKLLRKRYLFARTFSIVWWEILKQKGILLPNESKWIQIISLLFTNWCRSICFDTYIPNVLFNFKVHGAIMNGVRLISVQIINMACLGFWESNGEIILEIHQNFRKMYIFLYLPNKGLFKIHFGNILISYKI